MKLNDLPTGIRRKLWDIQRTVASVQADVAEGDDPFKFMPAPGVFDEVRRQLRLKQLMVVPSTLSSRCEGGRWVARVSVEVTDLEEPDSVEYVWEAESSEGLGAASTLALKGWYIATFLIQQEELSDERKHELREQRAKEHPMVTASQVSRYIGPAKAEAELTDDQWRAILAEECGVDDVSKVKRTDADRLVKRLKGIAKRKARLQAADSSEQPTEQVPVAAGPDTEPRNG